jgi:hypothetical protein
MESAQRGVAATTSLAGWRMTATRQNNLIGAHSLPIPSTK